MRKKTFFASQFLLFLGLAAIILAGCGTASTGGPNLAASQVLKFANIGTQDIKTTDPALAPDLNSAQAIYLLYSGLVTLDAKTLQIKPDIAKNWDISSDGKTYTFHIRSGIKFSNGDPVTAQDFAYSMDRAMDPNLKSNVASLYLGNIVGALDRNAGKVPSIIGTGVIVKDDLTLQVNLTAPAGYFLDAMTYPTSWAIDKKVVDQFGTNWADQHSAGTGPFQLKSWDHRVQLTFVPNPNWYGTKSHLTEIDMPMFADAPTAFKSYQTKEIDIDNLVDSADYSTAKALGPKQFSESPYLAIQYVSPNWNVPPFDNLQVRQAFAYAVDRDTIANNTLRGADYPSDHVVPQGQPGYNPNLKGLPFDPAKAKQLLQSVYPDVSKMPAVTLEYPKGGDGDKLAAELQSEYQQYLGVHVALNPVDFEQLINDVYTGKVQFYQLGWIADYPDAQDWTSIQFVTGSANNIMNFHDTNLDSLCAQADVEQDQAKRNSLYNQAEELAVDEVGWIPIFQQKNLYSFQTYIHGFVQDSGGLTPQDVWGDVYIEAH
jgi:peptide/nickel transport system substrate-binding protein/oligopeptide transport system substrate-binding protein